MSKLETPVPTVERDQIVVTPPTLIDRPQIQVPASPPTPWHRQSLAGVVACNAVALGLIAFGWFQASDSAVVNRQVRWLNVAIAGLALAAIGNMLWIRGQRRALVGLVDQGDSLWDWMARSTGSDSRHAAESAEVRLDDEASAGALVSGARMRLFHRPDCPFVAGKAVTGESRRAHEAAGRTGCAVCEP